MDLLLVLEVIYNTTDKDLGVVYLCSICEIRWKWITLGFRWKGWYMELDGIGWLGLGKVGWTGKSLSGSLSPN